MIREQLTGYPSIDKPWLQNYPDGARSDVFDGINMRMYDFMKSRVQQHLNEPAIEYFGHVITYAEVLHNIDRFAKALYGCGIRKGDFISVCLPNLPEIVYIKYACNRIGAVANLIDPRMNADGICERMQLSNSKLLFAVVGLGEKIHMIVSNIKIVMVSPSDSLPKKLSEQTIDTLSVNLLYFVKRRHKKENLDKYIALKEFLELGDHVTDNYDVPFEPDMPVAALYTSGTTADKMSAGVFTNENYNVAVKNQKYGSSYIQPGKRFLGVIPFFAAYGSFNGMHHSLCSAWSIILIPQFKPNQFAELFIKHRANAALGVPKFWEQFLELEGNTDLSFLEIPVVGGDWISHKTVSNLNVCFEKGGSKAKLIIGYGATEFSGAVSITSDVSNRYNPDSVGIVLPGNTAIIIEPETEKELPYDTEGELCISSPTMMKCYLNDLEKTNRITLYKNGLKFYKTGDKAKINKRGDIIFCDRYKRVMMRPDGHTVASVLIEDAIYLLPEVKSCAVVGLKVKETASGVIPTAFIVLRDHALGNAGTAKKIDEFCLTKLGERDRALAIVFTDAIPYTENGKVDFKKLEKTRFGDIDYHICEPVFFEAE